MLFPFQSQQQGCELDRFWSIRTSQDALETEVYMQKESLHTVALWNGKVWPGTLFQHDSQSPVKNQRIVFVL